MRKVIYFLLVVLAVVAVIRVVYEYRLHKEEIAAVAKFEKRQLEVTKKGAPAVQKVANVDEIEKIFYPSLNNCTPVNLADEDGTNFVIYGREGDNCSFEKYSISYSVQCSVPMDVAKKYAESGRLLKTYVDEVNNNEEYCKIVFEGTDTNKKEKKAAKKK